MSVRRAVAFKTTVGSGDIYKWYLYHLTLYCSQEGVLGHITFLQKLPDHFLVKIFHVKVCAHYLAAVKAWYEAATGLPLDHHKQKATSVFRGTAR